LTCENSLTYPIHETVNIFIMMYPSRSVVQHIALFEIVMH